VTVVECACVIELPELKVQVQPYVFVVSLASCLDQFIPHTYDIFLAFNFIFLK